MIATSRRPVRSTSGARRGRGGDPTTKAGDPESVQSPQGRGVAHHRSSPGWTPGCAPAGARGDPLPTRTSSSPAVLPRGCATPRRRPGSGRRRASRGHRGDPSATPPNRTSACATSWRATRPHRGCPSATAVDGSAPTSLLAIWLASFPQPRPARSDRINVGDPIRRRLISASPRPGSAARRAPPPFAESAAARYRRCRRRHRPEGRRSPR